MLRGFLIFAVSYCYYRFGLRFFGPINFSLIYPTAMCLWLSSQLWDPSEHLPFGTDMEYPHSAGLALAAFMGMSVILTRAYEEDDGEVSWRAFWNMRHWFVSFCIAAVAGYTLFLPYAYGMYQAFTEGNYVFIFLAIICIVALLAVVHNQSKSPATE